MSEREKRRVRWREGGREGGVRDRLRNRPRLSPKVYGYLTEEKETLRQGFAALFLSSAGELIAGIVLAGISGTLDELVGLAVLIPAAIGMRGAIFGAMGSRLSTSIQTGLFRSTSGAACSPRTCRPPPSSRSSPVCSSPSWRESCAASSASGRSSRSSITSSYPRWVGSLPACCCSGSQSSSPASRSPAAGTWITSQPPCSPLRGISSPYPLSSWPPTL